MPVSSENLRFSEPLLSEDYELLSEDYELLSGDYELLSGDSALRHGGRREKIQRFQFLSAFASDSGGIIRLRESGRGERKYK